MKLSATSKNFVRLINLSWIKEDLNVHLRPRYISVCRRSSFEGDEYKAFVATKPGKPTKHSESGLTSAELSQACEFDRRIRGVWRSRSRLLDCAYQVSGSSEGTEARVCCRKDWDDFVNNRKSVSLAGNGFSLV